MQYAFARGGKYFFGWFIGSVVFLLLSWNDKDAKGDLHLDGSSMGVILLIALVVAILAGGYVFFSTLSEEVERERRMARKSSRVRTEHGEESLTPGKNQ